MAGLGAAALTAGIPALFSTIGSLFGNSAAQNQEQTADAASAADTAQQSALDSQLMSQYDQLMSNYDQYDEGLLSPISTTAGQVLNESEPAQLSGFANAEDYLSNPNATLSGISGTGGYTLQQLYDESQQGLDPAYSSYLQSNLQNEGLQAINQVASEDLPNPTGAAGDIAMNSLNASASLDAQLAAQNQQVKNTALGALQTTAGGIDEQTLNNLLQGYSLATQPMTSAEGVVSAGQGALGQGTSGTTGIVNQYANAAGTAANNAQTAAASTTNPFSSLATMFAQNPNLLNFNTAGVPTPAPTPSPVPGASQTMTPFQVA